MLALRPHSSRTVKSRRPCVESDSIAITCHTTKLPGSMLEAYLTRLYIWSCKSASESRHHDCAVWPKLAGSFDGAGIWLVTAPHGLSIEEGRALLNDDSIGTHVQDFLGAAYVSESFSGLQLSMETSCQPNHCMLHADRADRAACKQHAACLHTTSRLARPAWLASSRKKVPLPGRLGVSGASTL